MKRYWPAVVLIVVPLLNGCGQKAYTRGPAVTPAPVVAGTLAPSRASARIVSSPSALRCGYEPPVWVNTRTHVFHQKGDALYGKTKHGGYLCPKDALAAGYRLAKDHVRPAKKP